MIEEGISKLWDEFAPQKHKAHGADKVSRVEHGHVDKHGRVILHEEPFQMVRCKCGELVKLPFVEAE